MKKTLILLAMMALSLHAGMARDAASPNGKITASLKDGGLVVSYQRQAVLELPAIGIGGQTLTSGAQLKHTARISADYHAIAGKREHCTNRANEYAAPMGDGLRLVVRLYDDGLALRYEQTTADAPSLEGEQTAYRIAEGTRRWMQQWADSYEGFFPLSTTRKVKAERSYSAVTTTSDGFNGRWGYPALLEPQDGVFALISEANIEQGQSASCLYNNGSDGELFRVVPDQTLPGTARPRHTPWRIAIIGSLADVVQSTLVTDVAEPSRLTDTSWIQPGVVSWIYWAYNHGSNDYSIICQYVDLAVALGLPYVLIDAEWDEMEKLSANNGKTIEDAVAYAKAKGVKPMIWYNSSVGWIDGAPTPKFRLNKAEDREREFAWLERIGVVGVKIDFFSGDTQQNMDYCIDLLESAARHHLLVNFHGATVPRGWQRTWPNLLSTEGVYGAEWYNNVPTFTKKAAAHNATLPFTRNVIGPMDYTPCAFSDSQHPHITTHAHELALTVLFESGLQHLADRPSSLLAQPKEVQQFFGHLPAAWDETRLLDGYPGKSVVMARRKGSTWYVAGINGTDEPLRLNIGPWPNAKNTVHAFTDGQPWTIETLDRLPQSVDCQPRGGFVYVIEERL